MLDSQLQQQFEHDVGALLQVLDDTVLVCNALDHLEVIMVANGVVEQRASRMRAKMKAAILSHAPLSDTEESSDGILPKIPDELPLPVPPIYDELVKQCAATSSSSHVTQGAATSSNTSSSHVTQGAATPSSTKPSKTKKRRIRYKNTRVLMISAMAAARDELTRQGVIQVAPVQRVATTGAATKRKAQQKRADARKAAANVAEAPQRRL